MAERGLLDVMIARLDELSCREKITLCEVLHTEQDLIQKSKSDIEVIIGRFLETFWNINTIRSLAERDAASAQRRDVQWVSLQDFAYPPLLRAIYDPPILLFYKGRLPNPEKPLAAIVGTRKPSPQAAVQAFDIAKGLARGGISVVSGLALGVDAMAHRGCVEGGAPTVAVLGSGVDEVYPSTNRVLARRVLETGGALLSEYPPGTTPHKWNFPARNRIISGLSRGIVIVEAPKKSGALITARFALNQDRDLWVASVGIGGDGGHRTPFDCPRAQRELGETNTLPKRTLFDKRGTEKLVTDGAPIINSASDILRAWNMDVNDMANSMVNNMANGATVGAAVASLADSLGIEIEA